MNASVKGSIKSKTMWAAALLLLLSNLAPLLPTVCQKLHLDPATTQLIGSVFAIVMGVLRSITNGSLADKVAAVPDPAPAPAPTPSVDQPK